MSDYESVLQTPDLGPGQRRVVEAHGDRVIVVNVGQRYFAREAGCPDSGSDLEIQVRRSGDRGVSLVCPDDDAEYDLRSGERLSGAGRPLRRYPVRVSGNEIQIGPAEA